MPARGTPEYIAECAKMAAIEDFCRQNTSASSTKSSRRRKKEATDEATHDASGAPEGTLGATDFERVHASGEGVKCVLLLGILINGVVSKACLERRDTCVSHFARGSGLVETGVQSMNPRFENAEFRNHVGLEMVDALRDVRSLSALRHCDFEKAWVDLVLDNVLS